MKAREPRRKVLIKARLRAASTWSDACILNLSSRGMLLQSAAPPGRGAYVEVCKGSHAIIARVVWSKGRRFGVRTQDLVPIDQLISGKDLSDRRSRDPANDQPIERRRSSRPPADRHQHSRAMARAFEFAVILFVGASAAVALTNMVADAIAAPLSTASQVLEKGEGRGED